MQSEFSSTRVCTVDVCATRQPVVQVEAVPDLKLVLALADGALSTWEAGNLRKKPAGGALDTKHALFFALNVRGPPRHKLCVVSSKKRLRLYAWGGDGSSAASAAKQFVWVKDLDLPDVPRALAYYGSRIACGYQRCVRGGLKSDGVVGSAGAARSTAA